VCVLVGINVVAENARREDVERFDVGVGSLDTDVGAEVRVVKSRACTVIRVA
jgi:hypothetical protein